MKDFYIGCILHELLFLPRSFNLIKFGRTYFLINIDFSKPGIIQGLSINFKLFADIFLELHKCQVKTQTFMERFIGFLLIVFDEWTRLS